MCRRAGCSQYLKLNTKSPHLRLNSFAISSARPYDLDMGFIRDVSRELATEAAELSAQKAAQKEEDEANLKIVRARTTELANEFIAISSEFSLGRFIQGTKDVWLFTIKSKTGEVIQRFGINDDGSWGIVQEPHYSGDPVLLSEEELTPEVLTYEPGLPPAESGIASIEDAFRASLRTFHLLPEESLYS